MSDIYTVPANIAERCLINRDTYQEMYQRSITDADGFWGDQASLFLDWQKPWNKVSEADLPNGNVTWFSGGQLNVSVNCIDRHLPERAQQTAIIWEGDEPNNDVSASGGVGFDLAVRGCFSPCVSSTVWWRGQLLGHGSLGPPG
jgi:acetyl-CoA synthetase